MVSMSQAIVALAPTAQFSIFGNDYSTLVWLSPEIPQPTEEQVVAEQAVLEQQEPINACKIQASKLLYETDWTTIPDVADSTKSNPYLVNVQDYVTYRNVVRQLAVYPVASPVWPTKPTSQWSS
jgi:hypothetical protein